MFCDSKGTDTLYTFCWEYKTSAILEYDTEKIVNWNCTIICLFFTLALHVVKNRDKSSKNFYCIISAATFQLVDRKTEKLKLTYFIVFLLLK